MNSFHRIPNWKDLRSLLFDPPLRYHIHQVDLVWALLKYPPSKYYMTQLRRTFTWSLLSEALHSIFRQLLEIPFFFFCTAELCVHVTLLLVPVLLPLTK